METAPSRITSVEFGVFSAQAAKTLSVLELTERNLYDISKPNRPPAEFGALDRRLGVADKTAVCATCNEGIQQCVGHFGVVRLVLPVFHIGYFRLMVTVLQNICKTCSRVMVPEPVRRKYLKRLRTPYLDDVQRKEILKSLNTLCKKTALCPWCGAPNGPIRKVGALKLTHERFKKKKEPTPEQLAFQRSFDASVALDPTLKTHVGKAHQDLNPLVVHQLFSKILDQDCEVLGLDPQSGRPELFLWNALPVPPSCIRPSVGGDAVSTEDDLTVLVSEIVEVNAKIQAILNEGIPVTHLVDHWDFLQLQCAMYITSDLPGVPTHLQNNLQKIKKGFCQRLKGKHGRFRGNLSGKRVDFSGRTVISPDPNLRIDQVAVPERVAKVLTYPERVTKHNIERMRERVLNGTEKHPGATYVTTTTGVKKFLKYVNRKQVVKDLRIGDLVDRHLEDGDIVLFNRQPSLHKLSIMSHFAKIRPWRTFRFNECVCNPYNADFDGDEMNMHVPQNEEARAEAMQLMGVKNNLVTPRNGEPLIAATQDFITASYLLTRRNQLYDRSQFTQICCYMNLPPDRIDLPPPCIVKPLALWSGKQIYSLLLKPNDAGPIRVNLATKSRQFDRNILKTPNLVGMPHDGSFCPNEGFLTVFNSQIMSGVVDKAIIGDGNKNSLLYVVLRDFGAEAAAACMNRIAALSARWLANQGFSIGIDDVQPGRTLTKQKELTVQKGYDDCDEMISASKAGRLQNQAGCNQEQTLEAKLSGILSKIRDDVGQVCFNELNPYNAPMTMALCGSKGSKINVSQMVACVGQQIVSGSRIPNGFIDRSLPHFPKNSKIPPAKGFVRNSFYTGLSPPEFFFHAAGGREGLVDTAVKSDTAETGYMQRRLMKALEDLTMHYDQSVRNSVGSVIQFQYGDDGLDPACIEGDQQPVAFTRAFAHAQAVCPPPPLRDVRAARAPSAALRPHEIRTYFADRLASEEGAAFSTEFASGLTQFVETELVERLARARVAVGLPPRDTAPADGAIESDDDTAAADNDDADDDDAAAMATALQITTAQCATFWTLCQRKYQRALMEAGTAVGAIGAQSIGEPGTQMTLKTFHFAGVASMNVTLGVPRIKEIINASAKISTPIINATLEAASGVYLKRPKQLVEASARVVKGRIEATYLHDVIASIRTIMDAEGCFLHLCIDLPTIRKLQLDVTLESIKASICADRKIKITPGGLTTVGRSTIRVSAAHVTVRKARSAAGAAAPAVGGGGDDGGNMYTVLQNLKQQLPKVLIHGYASVNRAVVNDEHAEHRFNLLVEGYGLREIMGIEGVDGVRTYTNHVLECTKTIGIEAGRNTIIHEILYTMEKHGMTIDRRHVMLLADLMTFKGEVLGITRFGIAKMKDSVLMLASFEKTTDHLFEASFYGKTDPIQGVSECIIMGIPMSLGTGLFQLLQRCDDPLPGGLVGGPGGTLNAQTLATLPPQSLAPGLVGTSQTARVTAILPPGPRLLFETAAHERPTVVAA
ncbi:hypothetical protein CXG81DRAFT_15380 [Caulochytrium protostelioides]|uniref:DNA-directed RNA polymerase subunit n=1 Tax=Caulochytrium protostelioides TaxID=1555241 RepID=A0A4P9X1Q0_9FUNG|nr:hypothetical protein CXG81DRAFT_15380 [Caulochytrium protostelioides]|eukprot:RKO98838.1 hypothetical protein CXG81DRAFT_15380 [Caulochytrium protostelioides]